MIKWFKTTTSSLPASQVDLSEKNEIVPRCRGYFEAKSKGYNITMKRTVKEYPL
jgi:hypothetical protein